MIVRRMNVDDTELVLEGMFRYFKETAFNGMTPDFDACREIIRKYSDGASFVAMDGENLAGFAFMFMGRTFYKEIEADCEMFFVLPEYRGKGTARALVEAILNAAETAGAKLIYSSGQSGIGEVNQKLWHNLWGKYGFEQLGTIMWRKS